MSHKKKTDIIKIFTCAVLAASFVLIVWLSREARYRNMAISLTVGAVAAFIPEFVLLVFMKSRKAVVRIVKIALLLIINASVFTCVVLYSFPPAIILQPHQDEKAYASLTEGGEAQEMIIDGRNGRIYGWYYNNGKPDAPTVLYFYGNYETASTRLSYLIDNYSGSAFSDCNFAVFDYPAYGKSEGNCSDKSLLDFSLDVYDGLSEITDNIIVLGYSVGTGPATYLASERDVSALVLYAPYSNGYDLYNNVIDIFRGPLRKLVAFNIESEKYAENITEKTLILASRADRLIPFTSSENLADKLSDCRFIPTDGIGHNEFLTDGFIREETEKFIKEVTAE